jgi:glycosyltransferase involved in cell wall biosynthesis
LLKHIIPLILENEDIQLELIGFEELTQNLIAMGFSQFTIEDMKSRIVFHTLGDPVDSSIKNIQRWSAYDSIIYESEPQVYFAPHFERGLPTTRFFKHSYYKIKTVVTVHDLIPLRNQSFSQKSPIHNLIKKFFYNNLLTGVKKANRIVTVSNFSKEDIKTFLKVDDSKISVVHLGVEENFYKDSGFPNIHDQAEIVNRYKLTGIKYMLYDSGIEENKGAFDLISVFAKLQQKNNDLLPKHLVITGGGFARDKKGNYVGRNPSTQKFIKMAKELQVLERVTFVGKVDEETLTGLLKGSCLYFYPSRLEGFGFPPLQAIAAEIPTVINNASCLPEISGPGSLIVQAEKHNESADSIEKFIQNIDLLKEKRELGLELLKKYNWNETAEKTLKVLVELF